MAPDLAPLSSPLQSVDKAMLMHAQEHTQGKGEFTWLQTYCEMSQILVKKLTFEGTKGAVTDFIISNIEKTGGGEIVVDEYCHKTSSSKKTSGGAAKAAGTGEYSRLER